MPAVIHDYGHVKAIDSFMHGVAGVTAVYYLPGPPRTIIETAPATSFDKVREGLAEAGAGDVDFIVLTHIHLDHAGAVGHFAREYPNARIVVRAEGAPHIADPTRLWQSASRLYSDMHGMWGEMLAVPEDRIIAVSEDETVVEFEDGGRLDALYTPGHAKHHMSLLERKSGDMFAGDAVGVYFAEAGVTRPATPPPDFDLESVIESVEKMRAFRPSRLFPTHFGAFPSVDQGFQEAIRTHIMWVKRAERVLLEGGDVDDVERAFEDAREEFYPSVDSGLIDKFERTSTYAMNAAGIVRYLRNRGK